jgi:hypothetical protein
MNEKLNYVPKVKGTGSFVAEWQKANGSFKGFGLARFGLCITAKSADGNSALWKSKNGNLMVCIHNIENDDKYNLPAGIFIGYDEEHPGSGLVLYDGENWTLNQDVPFAYDPIEGITLN